MSPLECVKTFPNRAAAEIARTALEGQGISSVVSVSDDVIGISHTTNGARLFVVENMADKAKEFLTTSTEQELKTNSEKWLLRFSLSSLFLLTFSVALTAGGYSRSGLQGALSGFVSSLFLIVGGQILRSVKSRTGATRSLAVFVGFGFVLNGIVGLCLGDLGILGFILQIRLP